MKLSSRKYLPNETVVFKNTKGEFGELSNMAPGFPLYINDIIIANSECLYQACRFPLFPEIQEEIINESNPMKAKWISRKYLRYTRQDWDTTKFLVMRWVLKVKLIQNWDKFSGVIQRTENKAIVELSTKDKIWAASKMSDGSYEGINALGRLLMELRKELNEGSINTQFVEPLTIPGFLLYGFSICRAYPQETIIRSIDKELELKC
ncbi:type I restriction-modification system specificity subunit [Fulvivirga imtechensis AK7]|uniref:Type I restriction-modification system specificity subunit n=1 Tax=Fulvivirga imtechensis AK7 TaxID=1237149 RepID=L8JSF7_9BACT|nr:NADAR family protein [Fulvivirga imtechensis]ELR71143.1 type I restriction-modification system specificity subunit [Fulvivirga imtechensis AK7]